MKTTKVRSVFCVAAMVPLLLAASSAFSKGTIANRLVYQGSVYDDSASEPMSGIHSVEIRLFSDAFGGVKLWSEDFDSVLVRNGVFRVVLGGVLEMPDTLFDGRLLWVESAFDGSTLRPRQLMYPVSYAIHAKHADVAETAMSIQGSGDGDWVIDGDNIHREHGKVGIGTSTPVERLDVEGNIHAAGYVKSGNSINIDGVNDRITATGGTIDFDDENLITTGKVGVGTGTPLGSLHARETAPGNTMVIDASSSLNPNALFTVDGMCAANIRVHHSDKDQLQFQVAPGLGMNLRSAVTIETSGNVGIGTTNPTEKLDVAGTLQAAALKIPSGASEGFVLTSDDHGRGTWEPASGGLGGGGTMDFVPKFTGAHILGNSGIYENGGNVGIGMTTPEEKLDVAGGIRMTGFRMPTGASPGYLLTTDSDGRGTWEPAPGDAIPDGTEGATLRHDGSTWVADDLLHVIYPDPDPDSAYVGIGTGTLDEEARPLNPDAKLFVEGRTASKTFGRRVFHAGDASPQRFRIKNQESGLLFVFAYGGGNTNFHAKIFFVATSATQYDWMEIGDVSKGRRYIEDIAIVSDGMEPWEHRVTVRFDELEPGLHETKGYWMAINP